MDPIEASVRVASRRRLGIQSLLNVLVVEALRRLLAFAERPACAYRYQLDVNSAARTIWTGLHTAQMNGSSAGKYGVAPMTLEEQALTVEAMTRWTRGWTAVSAFYVDTPLLAAREVYDDSRCQEAVVVWLKMARGGSAQIILFDSPDRINPRHLVRQSNLANDTRVLTMEAINRISKCAMELGVSMSGGITSHQAYELALRRVFGIFSRSSTVTKIAVTAKFERDPRFAAENEPTDFGFRRIHACYPGRLPGERAARARAATSEENRDQDRPAAGLSNAGCLPGIEAVLGWPRLQRSSRAGV